MRIPTLVIGCLMCSQWLAADPVAGKFWYEQNCARCHGSPPQERRRPISQDFQLTVSAARSRMWWPWPRSTSAQRKVLDVDPYLVAPTQCAWAPGIDFSDL